MDQNINFAACLQSSNYIGHTHYQNVCSGKAYDVAWGSLDWIGYGAAALFCTFLAAVLLALVVAVWRA